MIKTILVIIAVLFSTATYAGGTALKCYNDKEYVDLDYLTEDSMIINDDQFQIEYDKTEGDVHYTKMVNNDLNQEAYLIVTWGENNQVSELKLLITQKGSGDNIFVGLCTNQQ